MPTKYWISVVSKNHIMHGVEGGFVMVCHGKEGPLKRMTAGDYILNYSPTVSLEGKEPCQSFTAIGKISTGKSYQVDMGNGFTPFRMDVSWIKCKELSIRPFIETLSFITDSKRWGYKFRFGHFEIPEEDFQLIAKEMKARLDVIKV